MRLHKLPMPFRQLLVVLRLYGVSVRTYLRRDTSQEEPMMTSAEEAKRRNKAPRWHRERK